jgi:hypothetical protein
MAIMMPIMKVCMDWRGFKLGKKDHLKDADTKGRKDNEKDGPGDFQGELEPFGDDGHHFRGIMLTFRRGVLSPSKTSHPPHGKQDAGECRKRGFPGIDHEQSLDLGPGHIEGQKGVGQKQKANHGNKEDALVQPDFFLKIIHGFFSPIRICFEMLHVDG